MGGMNADEARQQAWYKTVQFALSRDDLLYDTGLKAVVEFYVEALREAGWRIVEPGHIPMPLNREEAAAMNLLSEGFLKSNPA